LSLDIDKTIWHFLAWLLFKKLGNIFPNLLVTLFQLGSLNLLIYFFGLCFAVDQN